MRLCDKNVDGRGKRPNMRQQSATIIRPLPLPYFRFLSASFPFLSPPSLFLYGSEYRNRPKRGRTKKSTGFAFGLIFSGHDSDLVGKRGDGLRCSMPQGCSLRRRIRCIWKLGQRDSIKVISGGEGTTSRDSQNSTHNSQDAVLNVKHIHSGFLNKASCSIPEKFV